MPNWCSNTLRVNGNNEDLKNFNEKFKSGAGVFWSGDDDIIPYDLRNELLLRDEITVLSFLLFNNNSILVKYDTKLKQARFLLKETENKAIEKITEISIQSIRENNVLEFATSVQINEKGIEKIKEDGSLYFLIKKLEKLDFPKEKVEYFLNENEKIEERVEKIKEEKKKIFLNQPAEYSIGNLYPPPAEVINLGYSRAGYDWCNRHWGTKWDICDVGYEHSINENTGEFGQLQFYFDTAWGPPDEAFVEISKIFPELVFELEYDEPGMQFAGEVEIQDGEYLTSSECGADDYVSYMRERGIEVYEEDDEYDEVVEGEDEDSESENEIDDTRDSNSTLESDLELTEEG
jgi:hypothetical protein